jgi:branched-chain amino acid transport system permease protein
MTADLVANVLIAGTLTGLIYGLMALGLSVIFGVVRVVNFAHGEMMTIAMFAAVALFSAWGIDPFLAVLPVALVFFIVGYLLQASLINPFITRPEYSQFMLLVAVAIVVLNGLLMMFGPNARNVQVDYQLESIELGPLLVDVARLYAAGTALACAAGRCSSMSRGSTPPEPRLPAPPRSSLSSSTRSPARRSAPAPTTTSARWSWAWM